jgi:hypothetical protein
MLGLLKESSGDVDRAMNLANKYKADELRKTYENNIDEDAAVAYNQMYRDLQPHSSFSKWLTSRWLCSDCL